MTARWFVGLLGVLVLANACGGSSSGGTLDGGPDGAGGSAAGNGGTAGNAAGSGGTGALAGAGAGGVGGTGGAATGGVGGSSAGVGGGGTGGASATGGTGGTGGSAGVVLAPGDQSCPTATDCMQCCFDHHAGSRDAAIAATRVCECTSPGLCTDSCSGDYCVQQTPGGNSPCYPCIYQNIDPGGVCYGVAHGACGSDPGCVEYVDCRAVCAAQLQN